VHLRVETFAALSQRLLERVDGLLAPEHVPADLQAKATVLTELSGDRDLHVVSTGERRVRTTIWSASGDAELSVLGREDEPPAAITLRAWLELLEEYVAGVVDQLEPTGGRGGSRP
jgi:hypothetical protein